jgi:hypothetical protein
VVVAVEVVEAVQPDSNVNPLKELTQRRPGIPGSSL